MRPQPTGLGFQGFTSTEIDDLLEVYRAANDDAKRIGAARKIHRLLHEEQPISYLFNQPACMVWNKDKLSGIEIHKLGFRQWDFYMAK